MEETTEPEERTQQVSVDYGDLSEVMHAATAWASYLRKEKKLDDAADRIDQAAARLRQEAFDSSRR
jgi:hypothetical protein